MAGSALGVFVRFKPNRPRLSACAFAPFERNGMSTSVYSPHILEETNLGIQRFDIRDEMLAASPRHTVRIGQLTACIVS